MHQFYRSFLRMPLLLRVLAMALFSILFFGMMIHLIEPESFPTVFEGIWWAIITTSTVGYGDYAPITTLGRLAAILLILIGAGFLSTYFITLASFAVKKQEDYMEGSMIFRGSRHVIIIGWNERSKEMIESICREKIFADIVLIDESLDTNPCSQVKVHFIKGRSSKDDVLIKANIQEAEKVIITADQHKDELEADSGTILALLAIKGLNPTIHAIVEILTKEQLANAKRAGANEIIESNSFTSLMMVHSLSSHTTFPNLAEVLSQIQLETRSIKQRTNDATLTYADLSKQMIDQGKLLVGLKRDGQWLLPPPLSTVVLADDELVVINQAHR